METVIGLVAVFFVTGMILWMRTHARFMKRDLEQHASEALSNGTTTALVLMAFLAVLREGFETSVFLLATFQTATSAPSAIIGAVLGIAVAIGLGYGIYRGGVRLNMQRFFSITGLFLILVAAGLVLSAFRTGHEAGWVTIGQGTTVDLAWLAPPGSVQSALISGVLGIPRDPRVIEVLAWACYLVPMLAIAFWPARHRPSRAAARRLSVAGAATALVAAVLLFVAVPLPSAAVPSSAPRAGRGQRDTHVDLGHPPSGARREHARTSTRRARTAGAPPAWRATSRRPSTSPPCSGIPAGGSPSASTSTRRPGPTARSGRTAARSTSARTVTASSTRPRAAPCCSPCPAAACRRCGCCASTAAAGTSRRRTSPGPRPRSRAHRSHARTGCSGSTGSRASCSLVAVGLLWRSRRLRPAEAVARHPGRHRRRPERPRAGRTAPTGRNCPACPQICLGAPSSCMAAASLTFLAACGASSGSGEGVGPGLRRRGEPGRGHPHGERPARSTTTRPRPDPVTFTVTNKDAAGLTEVELLSDQRIMAEKENLAPGLGAVSFTSTLGGGKYQLYCPGASKELTDFTVTGKASAAPVGVDCPAAAAGHRRLRPVRLRPDRRDGRRRAEAPAGTSTPATSPRRRRSTARRGPSTRRSSPTSTASCCPGSRRPTTTATSTT